MKIPTIIDANSQDSQSQAMAAFVRPDGSAYFLSGLVDRQPQCPKQRVALFAPDFFLKDENPWWTFEKVESSSANWLARLESSGEANVLLDFQEASKTDFETDFETIQSAIADGVLQKAVPVVIAKTLKPDNFAKILPRIFKNLVASVGDARALLFLNSSTGGLAGLSPELLFSWDFKTNLVKTVALAGTAPGGDPEVLLNDPKELYEHQLVIEGIVAALGAEGKVEVGETHVVAAGQLHHLKTEITCHIKSTDHSPITFERLVQKLHPTPALGIKSDQIDFSWLKQLHFADERRRFGAPFGIWEPGVGATVYVAIRNIQWTEGEILLATGCGIVEQSQKEREWIELSRKRKAVLSDLGTNL